MHLRTKTSHISSGAHEDFPRGPLKLNATHGGSPLSSSGKADAKGRPAVLDVLGREVAALDAREVAGDSQAEARAPASPGVGGLAPVETVKHVG